MKPDVIAGLFLTRGVSGSLGIYGLDIPHYCYIIQNPSRMRPSTLTPKPEEGRPGCASCHFHAEVTSAGNVETQSHHLARGDVVFQKGCLYCDSTIWGLCGLLFLETPRCSRLADMGRLLFLGFWRHFRVWGRRAGHLPRSSCKSGTFCQKFRH